MLIHCEQQDKTVLTMMFSYLITHSVSWVYPPTRAYCCYCWGLCGRNRSGHTSSGLFTDERVGRSTRLIGPFSCMMGGTKTHASSNDVFSYMNRASIRDKHGKGKEMRREKWPTRVDRMFGSRLHLVIQADLYTIKTNLVYDLWNLEKRHWRLLRSLLCIIIG